MSDKQRHRVHFEPTATSSTLQSVAGSSKPKSILKPEVPKQVVKLLTPIVAPEQDIKRLTSTIKRSRRSLKPATAKPSKGKAKKLFSKYEWDRIWSGMLCIECFKEGKEVRGLLKDHPQHVTEDVSETTGLRSLSQVAKDSESLARDKSRHLSKSSNCLPKIVAPKQDSKRLKPVAEPVSSRYEEDDEVIMWDNRGESWSEFTQRSKEINS